MKVAYVFATNMASTFKLNTMILPQLEAGNHGAEVVGMMFFDDNIYTLRSGDPFGERLAKVAREKGILLMACDQCAVRRGLAEGAFEQCGSGQVTPKGLRRRPCGMLSPALRGPGGRHGGPGHFALIA